MSLGRKDKILHIAFIGAGGINFGGPTVPYNHSSRLESLGGIQVLGIVDIDVKKAKRVLQSQKDNPTYSGCNVYETTTELLQENKNMWFLLGLHQLPEGPWNQAMIWNYSALTEGWIFLWRSLCLCYLLRSSNNIITS